MADNYQSQEDKQFEREYKLSLWWVNNKSRLKQIGIVLFIIFDVALISFASWVMIDAFLLNAQSDQAIVEQMVREGQGDLNAYTRATKAQGLIISNAIALPSRPGVYDMYAEITNPNQDWYAVFEYTFASSAEESESQIGFILPGELKPFAAFGIESSTTPLNTEIVLHNLNWRRIENKLTGDYDIFAEDRLQFDIQNLSFQANFRIEEERIPRISFDLVNDSAYSYFDPTIYILLRRGGSVVGVNRLTLSEIESGETQPIVVNWFGTIPQANSVDIIPVINILDPTSYKTLEGVEATDLRDTVDLRR